MSTHHVIIQPRPSPGTKAILHYRHRYIQRGSRHEKVEGGGGGGGGGGKHLRKYKRLFFLYYVSMMDFQKTILRHTLYNTFTEMNQSDVFSFSISRNDYYNPFVL